MAKVGEIRKGSQLGKKLYRKFIWANCSVCHNPRWVTLNKGKPLNDICTSCNSKARTGRGSLNPHWNGGRLKKPDGYSYIWLCEDDFFYPMARADSYVPEHRLVMAKHLGRCLHSWEIVHHKNHIRNDNRIENLQLVSDDRHRQITIVETKLDRLLQENRDLKIEIRLLRLQIRQLLGGRDENESTCSL